MHDARKLLTFSVDDCRLALEVGAVERVVRAVAVTPLPGAPAVIAGVVDMRGRVVPVVDTRAALGLAGRPIRASDQLVVVATRARTLALVVDAVGDVLEVEAGAVVSRDDVLDGLERVDGVLPTPSGLVLVHDAEDLLSAGDAADLGRAVEALRGDG